ncbi:E3 ubiquitin/ISG15 ligase TRIM25-like isoform X2 [Myxocyprinus asiaticus]|uniref:E3 ubiquitin/ISG15 ligase TRIM25-like isoform X2 n=1 Tax=Myxocyprinus asiaticus TaxID=70543 RepID=UPI002223A1A6|nr:E3 ubiquitin/ISG15 ligase TRIM25-like isoform X2 [Myxocyprinus asiaticus]
MGASNDKPLKCPLCHEDCRNQVRLSCEHTFCQGCIGELWSGSSTGPYFCPECKYEYKELPDFSDGASTSTARPSASWTLGKKLSARYSTKTLLGKRKSSSAFPGKYSGGYRLGSAPSSYLHVTDSNNVIDIIDSDDDTPAPPKRKPTADECPSGSQSPSVVWRNISTSETSTQHTHPETTSSNEIASPHIESSPDRNTSSVREDLPVASCRNAEAHRKSNTLQGEKESSKETPITRDTSSKASDLPRVNATTHSTGPQEQMSPSNSEEPSVFSVPSTSTERLSSSTHVPCHYCLSSDQKVAVKTCLVCGASMCSEHLRAHLEKPVFQNHPLVNAVEDVSLWRCQEHQEMNRIYCQSCGVCVCTVCSLVGSHKGHECISIRKAEQKLRDSLKDEMTKIQKTEKSIVEKAFVLSEKKHGVQTGLEEVRAAVLQHYQAMREALEHEEAQAMHCLAQEKDRVLGSIERQLDTLQGALISSQSILNTLQGMTTEQEPSQYQDQAFIMEYSKIAAQLNGLSDPVQNLKPPQEVNQGRLDCLQDWTERRLDTVLISLPHRDPFRLLYGISPTLDPDTAHPKLLLSDENRTVQYTETQQDYTEQETRFNIFPQVLGSHALDRGCYYWEVEVSLDEGRWKVGVSDGQIGRKGQKDVCRIGFYPNSWCLIYEKGKVEAMHDKVASPVCTTGLCKVGVLLDFNEGRLSFYSVAKDGALSLLYSFEHKFSEPLYMAMAVSKTELTICDVFTKPTTD